MTAGSDERPRADIALILAGGQARRMGGADKGRLGFGGETLLGRIIARLAPQAHRLLLSANGDPARFSALNLPVLGDGLPGFPGPLAGVLAGMRWAQARGQTSGWLLSAPCDCPFLPSDLAARLLEARSPATGERIVIAGSGGRLHPVIALWSLALADELEKALAGGVRKIDVFTAGYPVGHAFFDGRTPDPFFNINRPEDLEMAERLAREE